MPGRLYLTRSAIEVSAALEAGNELADLVRRQNISPGEDIVVLTPERQLTQMRWGIIPVGRVNARGRPVMETIINARSETVFDKSAFDGVSRAIVPADGWYEWTGKAGRKTAWRIFPKDRSLLAFAAISDRWEAPGGKVVNQAAMVTCAPSADVHEIHHRMGVLLHPDQFGDWLNGSAEKARLLMQPYPDGLLQVEEAKDVDWNAP